MRTVFTLPPLAQLSIRQRFPLKYVRERPGGTVSGCELADWQWNGRGKQNGRPKPVRT